MKHLVVMAAGGGHVMPGSLRRRDERGLVVSWLGRRPDGEPLVPPGFRSTGSPLPACAARATRQPAGALRRWRLSPVELADAAQRLAVLGWAATSASRRLGRGAGAAVADECRRRLLSKCRSSWRRRSPRFRGRAAEARAKAIVTGNPVRAEIEAAAPDVRLPDGGARCSSSWQSRGEGAQRVRPQPSPCCCGRAADVTHRPARPRRRTPARRDPGRGAPLHRRHARVGGAT